MSQSINKRTYYKTIVEEAKTLSNYGIVCHALKAGTKQPAGMGWQKRTATDLSTFKAGCVGVGILCGAVSQTTVLDIDDMAAWSKLLAAAKENGSDVDVFEAVPCVKTPSGGLHYYFAYNEQIGSKAKDIIAVDETGERAKIDIDTRNDGGQVVCPPSLYCATKPDKKEFEGIPYKWAVSFDDVGGVENLEPMPEWLNDLLTQKLKIVDDCSGKYHIKPLEEPKKAPKIEPREDNLEEPDTSDIGSVVGGTEHAVMTLEQVSQIVNGLKTTRFASYDDWCHMLWAVARWQEENDQDEDAVIDMLDEYCQICDGYESRRSVEKKYNEAFKGKNKEKVFTLGTLIHWLKEDDYATYCNVMGFSKLTITDVTMITRRDAYCWVDFVDALTGKVWESRGELDTYMKSNISRVLAVVLKEKGFYIKKDSCLGGLFSYVDVFKGSINFNIKYTTKKIDKRTKDKKPKDAIEVMSFSDYLKETNILKNYADIGCYPDEKVNACPVSNYNIWEGFQANTVEQVDESKIKDLQYILRELWASGDEKLYQYLLGWFRFVVAHPAEMTKVALFLYSEEGAGKGTFIDFFRQYVLGNGIVHAYTGIDEIIEKHNTNKKGKKLSIINEMGSSREQFISSYDKVKPLISDPIITENPKGKTIVQLDNIMNVIMCTNHKNSLYISESDRRYTCIEVSNAKCGQENKEWWAGVNDRIMNQETGDHFYTWLLSLDEKSLPNPRMIHDTKLRQEIISLSRDNVLVFADWVIEDNKNKEDEEEKRTEVQASTLFEEYEAWCKKNGERAKSNRSFGMTVKNVLGFEHTKTGNFYYLPPSESAVE